MSYFSTAIAAGLADIQSAAGETVLYYRGDSYISITAVPGDGVRRGQPADVIRLNGMRDWLVMVADLDFGDGATPPAHGDLVVFSGTTYEVLPGENGDVYSAPTFVQYRIHTKVISIE